MGLLTQKGIPKLGLLSLLTLLFFFFLFPCVFYHHFGNIGIDFVSSQFVLHAHATAFTVQYGTRTAQNMNDRVLAIPARRGDWSGKPLSVCIIRRALPSYWRQGETAG